MRILTRLVRYLLALAGQLRISSPWNYKIPLLIFFPYFFLSIGSMGTMEVIVYFFAAVLTSVGFCGIGYLTNDWADRKSDALADKFNPTQNWSGRFFLLILLMFVLVAFIPWTYLPFNMYSLGLIGLELILFFVYAFPPFRFKERKTLGLLTDALYAHVVPALLASWTYYLVIDQQYDHLFLFLFIVANWQFLSGLRNILSHQILDVNNDLASSTPTFVTEYGLDKSMLLLKFIFLPLEFFSFVAFLWLLSKSIDISWIFVFAGLVFGIINYMNEHKDSKTLKIKRITNYFLDDIYIKWIPLIPLISMLWIKPTFIVILFIHVLLFKNIIKSSFVYILHLLKNKFVRPFLGIIFLIVKRRLKLSDQKSVSKLAIVSNNENKYSETFIRSQIDHLPFDKLFYSAGYLPTRISFDLGKTFKGLSDSTWRRSSDADNFKYSLIKESVSCILANYGPCGVEIHKICKQVGIPLIVHFHGFDAYRNDALSTFGEYYKELFQSACAIISVSKHMSTQLLSLGCPQEKLCYRPCGVDTNYFRASRTNRDKVILFCGRFVDKKAPMLLLRVFHKVSNLDPDVRLKMIGDGELLSSCKTLVQELGIDLRVTFMGICSKDVVRQEMNKAQIFVQSSCTSKNADSEGTPVSLLEACSMELPIVATKHGGIPDVVIHEETGLLVDEGDEGAMEKALLRLLLSSEERKTMGKNGRKVVCRHFSLEGYIADLANLVNVCIKGKQ